MDSIFELVVEGTDRSKDKTVDELVNGMADIFAANHPKTTKEPDWTTLLRNAGTTTGKWKVMAARDAWKAEQQNNMFEQQHAQFEKRVSDVLSTSQLSRNKWFYEGLQKDHASL